MTQVAHDTQVTHDDHAVDDHGPHVVHETTTGISNVKLAMWGFLASDCLLFGGLITVYFLYRAKPQVGIVPKDIYDIPFTSITSFILLMSSLTMVLALSAINRGEVRNMRIWLIATSLLGSVFVGAQIYEFTSFIREGVTLKSNFASSAFFVLTGFHGVHVFVGIVILLSVVVMSKRPGFGVAKAENVEVAGLYWHFVDVVWILLFVLVYLLPAPSAGL
jgi:cytochrome c oxidase subunit 3/cytochrome o ubiquinol oxidase subunit 3